MVRSKKPLPRIVWEMLSERQLLMDATTRDCQRVTKANTKNTYAEGDVPKGCAGCALVSLPRRHGFEKLACPPARLCQATLFLCSAFPTPTRFAVLLACFRLSMPTQAGPCSSSLPFSLLPMTFHIASTALCLSDARRRPIPC